MAKSRLFRAFCLAVLFFGSVVKSFAQLPTDYFEEVPRTFYGGLVLGSNFCQVDGDNYAGYYKVGLNAGGIVYANLADHLAASIEILFSQKGAHSNGVQTVRSATIEDYTVNFNYAEVPIQLNYFDKRKSHFGAGISVSRLINYTEKGDLQFTTVNPDFDKYPFKKMDYQFVIGGNLHLWKGLFLNIRWQYSLVSIRNIKPFPNNEFPFAGRDQQFNNMYTVRLMYLFQ